MDNLNKNLRFISRRYGVGSNRAMSILVGRGWAIEKIAAMDVLNQQVLLISAVRQANREDKAA